MMQKATRLIGTAGALVLIGAGLVGCQASNRQSDAFGSGSDRPPTARTLHMMAKLINENGRVDQAEFVLSRIITDTPEYLPAYVELADLYIGRGKFSDARDTLRQARVVSPTDAVIANNLGVLLLREGSFVEASEVFVAAVTQDPSEARYHANLAVSYAMSGSFDQAYEAWLAVLPAEEVLWNLGVVAEAQGNPDVAGAYFASANRLRKGEPANGAETEFYTENAVDSQIVTVAVPVD